MGKQPGHLNFGFWNDCEHKGQSRYLLCDKEIDWNEELNKVDESKLEEPATSSEIKELCVCPLDIVEQLSPEKSETENRTVPQAQKNEITYCTSSSMLIQELAKCEKIEISHKKNMLLQCDRKQAVGCNEDEALSMEICLSMHRDVFNAKDNVSDLQQSSFGIGKLTLCEAVQRSHGGTVSEVNNWNKGGKRLKAWDYEEADSSGPLVKRICMTDISGSASTYTSLLHKKGFRCVDEQSPANSYLSALSLFKELGRLSPVYKQNILQEFIRLVCGTCTVHVPFPLLDKPVGVLDVPTDHKIFTWGGNSDATVGVDVTKYKLLGPLETSQKLNAFRVTLCAYLNKSRNDLEQCILPESEEQTTKQNNATSSQTVAKDGNIISSVQEKSVTEVQDAEMDQQLVDCGFFSSLPMWSNVPDVQSETAEGRVQNRDNRETQRKLYSEEHITDDSLFLPSSGAVVSELQSFSDRSSLMLTEDHEEFSVPATDELWTLEDIFASGEVVLPLCRPIVQKTTYHISNKIQSRGDENLLKLNNMSSSNGVLSPDYGFWEGDDAVGLSDQTASLNDKFCNVLDEHCNTLTSAYFPKTVERNHSSYENIFQKEAEHKEKDVVERLCELLDVGISDSNKKDTDKSSDAASSVVTKLPNIAESDQAVNKCVKHKKVEQKQGDKVVLSTDSQFQQISPEHVSLDTECLSRPPQEGVGTKEMEILDCPFSIADSLSSLSSEEEKVEEEDDDDDDDDDDNSSESSSSVVTVVLNPSWVPQNTHRCSLRNQSQQRHRGGNGSEDESVPQHNDHTYATVECQQPSKPISCVQRTNSPMTDSEINCDNNERAEIVHHTLCSDQSCSGPQSDAESADENEPPMRVFDDLVSTSVHSTKFGNSPSFFINSSETCSDLDQKLDKDSDTRLVETKCHSDRTAQTDPQCSKAVHLDHKYNDKLESVQKLQVISELQTPSSCITKAKASNLSPSNLMVVPRSKIQVYHQKTNTVAKKILCKAKKKILDIHRTSVGETLLLVKQTEKVSRSSSAEKESIQSNAAAQKFVNIEQAEHYTSKRKRKCESVKFWLQNTIESFSGVQDKHVTEEISKDAACNLPKEGHDAPRVRPVSISPGKCSSIDRRSDEKPGFETVQTDVQSLPDSTESPASQYKRRRETSCGKGLVTVQTYLTDKCSVKKKLKEGTEVKSTCQYCGKVFYRPSKLRDHIGTHTLPYHCLRCGRRFAKESQLVAHEQLLSCSPHEKCRYKCEGCDQKFLQRVCLLNHVEKHLKEDKEEGVEQSRCKLCGKVFNQAKLLLLHEAVHVAKGRLHTCRVCGKTFKRQAALARHLRTHLECNYCGDYFKGKDPLRTHIRQHLRNEKEKALKQKRKVQQEENVVRDEVTGTFPIVQSELSLLICPNCGKIFHWKTALQRHLAEHKREDHKKVAADSWQARFHCNDCGTNFTSKGSLLSHACRHVRADFDSPSVKVRWPRHHSERTSSEQVATPSTSIVLEFSCEKCHANFSLLSELQKHSCGLDDRRQYSCYICDKAFLSPKHLRHHRRTHFPQYLCRYCGHTFARRYEWRYHEWHHENDSS